VGGHGDPRSIRWGKQRQRCLPTRRRSTIHPSRWLGHEPSRFDSGTDSSSAVKWLAVTLEKDGTLVSP
jgi:hypothetical protein